MHKKIICISNSGEKGKTESLRNLATILINNQNITCIKPENRILATNGDFRAVFKIDGIIIGIESQGDPNTGLKNRLTKLFNDYNCQIIVCASRTKGDTVHDVESFAKSNEFQIIWSSTYETSQPSLQIPLNQQKGQHLNLLIDMLIEQMKQGF